MIKINIDASTKQEIETLHYKDIKKSLAKAIKNMSNSPKYKKLKEYAANEENLKKLIIGSKEDMKDAISNIGELKLDKDNKFNNLYNNFTNRNWSKTLLDKLNINVCPYCNRQYTFTIKEKGIRPQFDHYFPKSKYPYLAVSLYNLIPCCSICNSKKSDIDTYKQEFIYPYDEEYSDNAVFKTKLVDYDFLSWIGESDNFEITIDYKDNKDLNSKIKNTVKHLALEELYSKHTDYVKDIIKKTIIYNDSRINELLDSFPELFSSKEELINSIFMNYMDKDNWDKRPLSKLTYDIYNEFKML